MRRRVGVVAAVLVAGLALSGCAPSQPATTSSNGTSKMSAAQAQQKVMAMYDAVTAIVGTTNWDPGTTPVQWGDCSNTDSYGTQIGPDYSQPAVSGARRGPLPADPHTIVVEVQKAWAKLGVRVPAIRKDPAISPPGQLILSSLGNPDQSTYYFAVTEDYANVDFNGPCVRGDGLSETPSPTP